jgi:hypothetical protein
LRWCAHELPVEYGAKKNETANPDDYRQENRRFFACGFNRFFLRSNAAFFNDSLLMIFHQIVDWRLIVMPSFGFSFMFVRHFMCLVMFMNGVMFVLMFVKLVIIGHRQKTPSFRLNKACGFRGCLCTTELGAWKGADNGNY